MLEQIWWRPVWSLIGVALCGAAHAAELVVAPASAPASVPVSMSELRERIDRSIEAVRERQQTQPARYASPRRVDKKPEPPREWSYTGDTGPAHWGALRPEYRLCSHGQRQSPIDLRDGLPLALEPIAFDYHPASFSVVDTGRTIEVKVAPGSSITHMGRRYDLTGFHFHHPGEEVIAGQRFDMSVHLVHRDAEGREAIVALPVMVGAPHPLATQVWTNLPLEKGQTQEVRSAMDLRLWVPTDPQRYYAYMGSRTTPPCQEGVLWLVMKTPTQLASDQVAVLGRLYPMNARPVQPTQGRRIKDGQ